MKIMRGNIIFVILLVGFVIVVGGIGQAYSYSEYYGGGEGEKDDEKLEYYDYHTGRWEVIPEPDPVSYCYGGGSSSVIMMMPLFIIFFVVFFPWLVYALVRAVGGRFR